MSYSKISYKIGVLGLVVSFFPVASCTAYTADDLSDEGVDSTGSLRQELSASFEVKYVVAASSGGTQVSCPSSHSYALGSGHWYSNPGNGMSSASVTVFGGKAKGAYTKPTSLAGSSGVQAVCSIDAGQETVQKFDSDGNTIVSCPAGTVAVGGGGNCHGSGAKLTRSRPSPDSHGSTPTGWSATCSSGTVTATVNCLPDWWDPGCKTMRRDDSDGRTDQLCGTMLNNDRAVAVGAYCGGGGHITATLLSDDLKQTIASCSGNTIHGYTICCEDFDLD